MCFDFLVCQLAQLRLEFLKLTLVKFWQFDFLSILSSYLSYRIQFNLKLLKLQVRRTALHSENVVRHCPYLYFCFLKENAQQKCLPLQAGLQQLFPVSAVSWKKSGWCVFFNFLSYYILLNIWLCNGIYVVLLCVKTKFELGEPPRYSLDQIVGDSPPPPQEPGSSRPASDHFHR